MALSVEIDGNPVVIQKGSVSIEKRIGERSTASFTIEDITGIATYVKGQPVEVFDTDLNTIFAGFIDTPGRARIGATGSNLLHDITCIDNHYLVDKRLVVKVYTNQTLEYIVEDILTDYLAAEGVHENAAGDIQTGPVIKSAIFNYVKASEAFDSLAELSGYIWLIDENKHLYFIDRTTNSALWNLDSTTHRPIKGSVHLSTGNPVYRNRQYVRGGKGITAEQTETFTGDGVTVAFTVGYPIAEKPTVTVAGGDQDEGIKGIDTGKDCYWNKGDATITFANPPGAVPVVIVYYGQYPLIARADSYAGILTRQGIEGGTGIVEEIVTEAQHESADAMRESAKAKLTYYCQDAEKFIYQTHESGLSPGQLQEITYSPFGFTNHQMLIESILITAIGDLVLYDITCITGPAMGSWTRFFSSLIARQDKQIKIGDSLLLVLLHEANTLELTESTAIYNDEFAVSGQVNRWLSSAPIDAGSIHNIEHERLEMTENTDIKGNLTEAYMWGIEFIGFTEVDLGGKLTVTNQKALAIDARRNENVYLYTDDGVNHWNALHIEFEIYMDAACAVYGMGGIAIANTISTVFGFAATDISCLIERTLTLRRIDLVRGAFIAHDFYVCDVSKIYYCTLVRAAGSDTVTLYIYTDPSRMTLVDTLSVLGFGAGTRYQYSYGFVNYNDGLGTQRFDGYVQNMALQDGGLVHANWDFCTWA